MDHILIVEDDVDLGQGLCLALQSADTGVTLCSHIARARQTLHRQDFDLVLLDIGLPDGSGLDFLQEVKTRQDIPVLLLTAKDTELDIVGGFACGADDYIAKPFSLAILRARVQAQLRQKKTGLHRYAQGDYLFDFDNMLFQHQGVPVELSKTEQKLLRLLVDHRGMALSRQVLLDRVWDSGGEFVDENTLSVAIKRLRDKLGAQDVLKTLYGLGYIWEMP